MGYYSNLDYEETNYSVLAFFKDTRIMRFITFEEANKLRYNPNIIVSEGYDDLEFLESVFDLLRENKLFRINYKNKEVKMLFYRLCRMSKYQNEWEMEKSLSIA